MIRKIVITGVLAGTAALGVAACGSQHPSGASIPAASPAAASSPSAPAEPDTAAGAQAAASQVFELYSAGQYAAVYADLTPSVRSQVSEATYAAVHQECLHSPDGLAYQVTDPVVSGSTAVVTVSIAGAASALGAETQTFDYAGGRWLWAVTDTDYSGTAAQIVARLTAAGECGG